jgi:hypothetical protein
MEKKLKPRFYLKNDKDPSSRHPGRGVMTACSFKKLLQLLDKQLDLDEKLEVLDHLDTCRICRDAIYQISRDRDEAFFVYRPYNVEKNIA